MTSRWTNVGEAGPSMAFEALQSALSVSLIATPRAALKTCRADEVVSAVVESNQEQFDYIPVVANSDPMGSVIVGMFYAEEFRTRRCDDLIAQHMEPLSEDHLVGAATSILEFIADADSRPSRLVVFGGGFLGLVTISDLQKLPVRAALFAAITSFEMTMSEVIRRRFSSDDEWMALLSDGRKGKIREAIEISRGANGFVDALLFTQFCDKGDIIRKSLLLPHSAETLKSKFNDLQKLRNHLAHANDYASTPMEVKQLCGLLGDLLSLRTQIVAASQ
jgi:hypothetical protein